MDFRSFIVPLFTHFIIALPSCLYNALPMIYDKYRSRNDGPIVTHQSTDDTDVTIVFTHGRNGVSANFVRLINNLKKIGITHSMIAVNLGPTGSTSVTTDALTLRNILKDFDHKKIILVGLSKGGLIVSEYVATYDIKKNVIGVATISSPLDGTMIASWLMPKAHIARIELGYKSKFTQELKTRLPVDIPFFHIVPTWDNMIIPTSSAAIEGPNHESKIYSGFNSHYDICYAPEVAHFIADWTEKITNK